MDDLEFELSLLAAVEEKPVDELESALSALDQESASEPSDLEIDGDYDEEEYDEEECEEESDLDSELEALDSVAPFNPAQSADISLDSALAGTEVSPKSDLELALEALVAEEQRRNESPVEVVVTIRGSQYVSKLKVDINVES